MSINYSRLKTNLSLAIQRLKLLEKKKTEAAQKSRKEIADYIENGKVERAKIRVEHIIREDYLVEAMEIVEMLCDLLLARFGMIQQMKTLDDGLEEAVASLIWVAPRMSTDVKELKVIADLFTDKYGKQFAQACKENSLKTVNEKLMLKLGVQAPPKILIEKYLIEIAKMLGVNYVPDEEVLIEDNKFNSGNDSKGGQASAPGMSLLIDLNNPNVNPSNQPPTVPPNMPSLFGSDSDYLQKHLSGEKPPEIGFINLPEQTSMPPSYDSLESSKPFQPPPPSDNSGNTVQPAPPAASVNKEINLDNLPSVPILPDIPDDTDSTTGNKSVFGNSNAPPSGGNQDDVDFDDLRRRFEDLKKRK